MLITITDLRTIVSLRQEGRCLAMQTTGIRPAIQGLVYEDKTSKELLIGNRNIRKVLGIGEGGMLGVEVGIISC